METADVNKYTCTLDRFLEMHVNKDNAEAAKHHYTIKHFREQINLLSPSSGAGDSDCVRIVEALGDKAEIMSDVDGECKVRINKTLFRLINNTTFMGSCDIAIADSEGHFGARAWIHDDSISNSINTCGLEAEDVARAMVETSDFMHTANEKITEILTGNSSDNLIRKMVAISVDNLIVPVFKEAGFDYKVMVNRFNVLLFVTIGNVNVCFSLAHHEVSENAAHDIVRCVHQLERALNSAPFSISLYQMTL